MRRVCSSCLTPLPGKRGHGFVKGPAPGRLVCGRSSVEKLVPAKRGGSRFVYVSTPGCRA